MRETNQPLFLLLKSIEHILSLSQGLISLYFFYFLNFISIFLSLYICFQVIQTLSASLLWSVYTLVSSHKPIRRTYLSISEFPEVFILLLNEENHCENNCSYPCLLHFQKTEDASYHPICELVNK